MRTIVASLVVLTAHLWAYSPSVDRVTITNVGIYQIETKPEGHGRTPSERPWDVVTKFRRVESTTTVPASLCVTFGFEYVISGAPIGADIPVRMVTIFPGHGIYNPETRETMYRKEAVVSRSIGRSHFRSYTLDEPWVLVPGTWTFELWHGDRKLAQQSFTLVPPCRDNCVQREAPKGDCAYQLVALQ